MFSYFLKLTLIYFLVSSDIYITGGVSSIIGLSEENLDGSYQFKRSDVANEDHPLHVGTPKMKPEPRRKIRYLMVGGLPVDSGESPWTVGIYDKTKQNEQVCAGSIITPYIILTAGHCFFDPVTKASRNFMDYTLTVGKVFREYDIVDTEFCEYYEIESMLTNSYFSHEGKCIHDIAVVVPNVELRFNSDVNPIQLPFLAPFEIPHRTPLHIYGWGNDETTKPSTILRSAVFPYHSFNECLKLMHNDTKSYLSSDQFCVTHERGTSLSIGDSGGSVVYKDANSKPFLVGLVSFSEFNGGSPLTAITNIYNYTDFIKRQICKIHGYRKMDVNYLHVDKWEC